MEDLKSTADLTSIEKPIVEKESRSEKRRRKERIEDERLNNKMSGSSSMDKPWFSVEKRKDTDDVSAIDATNTTETYDQIVDLSPFQVTSQEASKMSTPNKEMARKVLIKTAPSPPTAVSSSNSEDGNAGSGSIFFGTGSARVGSIFGVGSTSTSGSGSSGSSGTSTSESKARLSCCANFVCLVVGAGELPPNT